MSTRPPSLVNSTAAARPDTAVSTPDYDPLAFETHNTSRSAAATPQDRPHFGQPTLSKSRVPPRGAFDDNLHDRLNTAYSGEVDRPFRRNVTGDSAELAL